jgi:hypothetical protein
VHKQSKLGVVPQVDLGKSASRKEMKHDRAHDGMNIVMSFPKVYVPDEDDWAIAGFVRDSVYIKASKLAGKMPILRML